MVGEAALIVSLVGLALVLSQKVVASGGVMTAEQVRALAEDTVQRYFPAVDPVMLQAMARIESSYNPAAFRYEANLGDASSGLMQTLRSTARWLWDDMGARAFGRPDYSDLTDPGVSMYFGAAYVNWLRRYKGQTRSEEWIVRAYNGGPGFSTGATQNHWNKYQAAKAAITGGS